MSISRLLEESFDELLTKGCIKRKVQLSEKLNISVSPLSEDQLLSAKMAIPKRAKDDVYTYAAAETLEILSRAVIEVNDVPVILAAEEEIKTLKEEGLTAEQLAVRSVRDMLLKLPPKLLNFISEEYNLAVREQSDLIRAGLGDGIENF